MVTDTASSLVPRYNLRRRALGRDWRLGWLLVLPILLVLLGLIAYPFVLSIILSFTDKMIGQPAHFVGLQNYHDVLFGAEFGSLFWKSVGTTIIYTAGAVGIKVVLGMGMALFLHEEFRGRNLMRALCFLPWAIPSLITGLSWQWIFNGSPAGMLNQILIDLGLSNTLIQWLGDPHLALWSVIFVTIWAGCPFYGMMLLAGLQSIPKELYEAASIDGANVFQRYRHVTLPGLAAVLTITVLLSTMWTANGFNLIYILTGGGPADSTLTFPMLTYQVGIAGAQQLGTASTITILFLPFFLIMIVLLTRHMLREEI
jgi:multiple sugar transport system permease protein